jgi:hypothetical protein
MELSLFLAQLMGISLAVFSLAGIVRPTLIHSAVQDFDHETFSTLSIGFMAMVAGLALILSHSVWDGTWRVWISLFGWSAFLKGCVYMMAPQQLIGFSKTLFKNDSWIRMYLVATLVLGLYLTYKGFGN